MTLLTESFDKHVYYGNEIWKIGFGASEIMIQAVGW